MTTVNSRTARGLTPGLFVLGRASHSARLTAASVCVRIASPNRMEYIEMPRSLNLPFQHNICRFCKKYETEGNFKLVKYGVRHYAHADCGLKAKGVAFFDSLTDWQCTQFPYFAAKEAGAGIVADLILRIDRYNAVNKARKREATT